MHTLSQQFLLLDGMRKAAGVSPRRAVRRARMSWLRYLSLRTGLIEAKRRDVRAFARALNSEFNSRARPDSPSVVRTGTAAPLRDASGPALTRDLRVAVPPVFSGEG